MLQPARAVTAHPPATPAGPGPAVIPAVRPA
jgi:hypothetical protein